MSEWVRAVLDLVLIGLVGAGLVQAARLIKHLSILKQSRVEMERFVQDFNSTVIRAEAGIKGLRTAARESGDDLEKLVEKAFMVRDELQFIVESADQIADRLSGAATTAIHPEAKAPEAKPAAKTEAKAAAQTPANTSSTTAQTPPKPEAVPSSRAEKELLQALKKLS